MAFVPLPRAAPFSARLRRAWSTFGPPRECRLAGGQEREVVARPEPRGLGPGLPWQPRHIIVRRINADAGVFKHQAIETDLLRRTDGSEALHKPLRHLLHACRPGLRLPRQELPHLAQLVERRTSASVNPPRDGNWLGAQLTRTWAVAGDVVRDLGPLFAAAGLPYEEREAGGCGSVHLYIATKP